MKATKDDHRGEILGTNGDDVLIGDDGANEIFAFGGVDRVCGGGGDDVLLKEDEEGVMFAQGGAGNDEIAGGFGNDTLFGGGGGDVFDAGRPPGIDTMIGEGGTDTFETDQIDAFVTCQEDFQDDPFAC
jgi:Ca2+-binding RTX toxin-like protein